MRAERGLLRFRVLLLSCPAPCSVEARPGILSSRGARAPRTLPSSGAGAAASTSILNMLTFVLRVGRQTEIRAHLAVSY